MVTTNDGWPVVLLDCDGVLSDFVGAYLRTLTMVTGSVIDRACVDRFKVEDCAFFTEARLGVDPVLVKRLMNDRIERRGFVEGMAVMPGALEGVEALREVAHVYVATAPWHSSPHWMHERMWWLRERLGFDATDIVHVSRKDRAHGDMLVDDRISNVVAWPHGRRVVWDQPYNQGDLPPDVVRVSDWGHVRELVRSL